MEITDILGNEGRALGQEGRAAGRRWIRAGQTPLETAARAIGGGTTYAAGAALSAAGIGLSMTGKAVGAVAGVVPATGRLGMGLYNITEPLGTGAANAGNRFITKSLRGLANAWDRPYGKRTVLSSSLGIGAVLGGLAAGFETILNPDSTNVARGVDEGSAYEGGGTSAFGGVRAKMPYASGAQVMGQHNARHG